MNNKFAVVYKGDIKFYLNSRLLAKQEVSDENIEKLKEVHVRKLEVFDKMKETDDKQQLKELAITVENIEFELQKLWGFKEDKNMHEWYMVPKCTCPKMDNYDYKGTEFKIINLDCPVHGE